MDITAASIKPHYHHHHTYNNVGGVPLNPPNSPTKAFAPNGIDCCCCCCNISADIEMITLKTAAAYTSLKDLMPTSPSAPNTPAWSTGSPATSRKESLRDIPINLKDPLLQHAAWAYLQPAMTPHDHRPQSRSFLQRLKHHCCGLFGCFNDVLTLLNTWFPANDRIRRRRGGGGPDDDVEEQMEEEDQENAAAPGACPSP